VIAFDDAFKDAVSQVHADVMKQGWAVCGSQSVSLPTESDVISTLEPSLVPDPRGPGKMHSVDIIDFTQDVMLESPSTRHPDGTDDYSRFRLLDDGLAIVPAVMARLIPAELHREDFRLTAGYFRYTPGVMVVSHQDQFADLIFIWVLSREGSGGSSFLRDLRWQTVVEQEMPAGSIMVFRDEMFWHGLSPLEPGGSRDALIFTRLRGGV
jgi:hypothetical protein